MCCTTHEEKPIKMLKPDPITALPDDSRVAKKLKTRTAFSSKISRRV
jgi:hypothetical protein